MSGDGYSPAPTDTPLEELPTAPDDVLAAQQELEAAQAEVERLERDMAIEAAQTAADVAGIFDPTPTSDAVSAGISIARGDWLGAGLSAVSMIPYLGDAVAKPIKAS